FYPDRMASRILGMGDVLTLVENAQEEVDIADAEKLQEKILSAQFDFDDFLKQTRLMKNMGSLAGIMKMIPGMGNKLSSDQLQQGEQQLKRCEAMIKSMTKEERKNPEVLAGSPSRRRRVAKGAGYSEKDISKLVTDFQRMRGLMQQMGQGNMGLPGFDGGFPGMGGMGGNPMGGNPMGGAPRPGWRGAPGGGKKKKKNKKKKGFGSL
ncbi:MAG: signal recognition particle protein, partial [Phormidesmis sp.]